MKFRPCIDIKDGKVKQIQGGSLKGSSAIENFVSDKPASYFAELYKKHGLTGGHIIALDSLPETLEQAREVLKFYYGGMQFGGGVTPENAEYWLDLGASKVIVSSYLFTQEGDKWIFDYKKLDDMIRAARVNDLVLDLSCRKGEGGVYYAVINRWQTFTTFEVNAKTLTDLATCCSEFLIHGVDVEGKKGGIEPLLLAELALVKAVPVTYAGGIRDLQDIALVHELGRGRIDFTVGTACSLFGGDLPYETLAQSFKGN